MKGIRFVRRQLVFSGDFRRNISRAYGYQFIRGNEIFRDFEKWKFLARNSDIVQSDLEDKYGSLQCLEEIIQNNEERIREKFPKNSMSESFFKTIRNLENAENDTKDLRYLMLRYYQIKVPDGMSIRQAVILVHILATQILDCVHNCVQFVSKIFEANPKPGDKSHRDGRRAGFVQVPGRKF